MRETEIAFYLKHLNRYGLPLDNRKDYTKLDWELWTATLADNAGGFREDCGAAWLFANESPSRVPLTDWYDTKTASAGLPGAVGCGRALREGLCRCGAHEKMADYGRTVQMKASQRKLM